MASTCSRLASGRIARAGSRAQVDHQNDPGGDEQDGDHLQEPPDEIGAQV
jgi:hypothetical protein